MYFAVLSDTQLVAKAHRGGFNGYRHCRRPLLGLATGDPLKEFRDWRTGTGRLEDWGDSGSEDWETGGLGTKGLRAKG